jgi:hypothetical protein
VGLEQSCLGELLQGLGQKLCRDVVLVGDILGAERNRFGVLGQELERHQPVIRLFGQLKHGISDFFGPCSVYDQFCRGSRSGLGGGSKKGNPSQPERFIEFWRLKFNERPLQSAERAS